MSKARNQCAPAVLAAAAAAFALAGCAPLQQAALMYASKSAVGLDVAVGTTDTPGGSVTIGFKMVDAAYVPVAVSKKRANDTTAGDLADEILRIEAQFGEGSAAAQLAQLSEDDKEKLKAYLDAKLAQERALAALARTEAAIKKNEADLSRYTADLDQSKAEQAKLPATASTEAKKKLADDILELGKRIEAENSDIAKGKALRASQADRLREAQSLVATRLAEAQNAIAGLRTDKRDALSVYGRFNAEGAGAAASSPTGKLTAGKIFSTGVASQNLTEAVRFEAEAISRAQCLDSVAAVLKTLKEEERAKYVDSMQSLCRSKPR